MATAKKSPAAKTAKPGTAVAVKKPSSGAIVNIQEQLRAQAAAMAERTQPASGNSIRVTQSKEFVLPNGQKTSELQLVIVDFVARNDFYEGKFDPKNIVPPVCAAIGSNPLKLVPFAESPQLQCEDCASCPMNAFGSDGDGKACKNSRVLAVLPPDGDESTPLWTLKVSPTALKRFDGFVRDIARTFQAPPVAVVVTVGFDENSEYASLVFTDAVANENLAVHFARQAEAQELLNVVPDFTRQAAPAKPAAKPAAKAPARRPVARAR